MWGSMPMHGLAFGVLDLDVARRGRIGAMPDRVLVIIAYQQQNRPSKEWP
jgi:hypothetical protein